LFNNKLRPFAGTESCATLLNTATLLNIGTLFNTATLLKTATLLNTPMLSSWEQQCKQRPCNEPQQLSG